MAESLLTVEGSTEWLKLSRLVIRPGDVVALHGESGAGKSRLLRTLADLDPNTLDVTLNGTSRENTTANQWRKTLQYLPAEPVWWTETATEVITAECAALADNLGLKAQLLDQPISRLSTGERQRLALLRSLSVSPSILLLDEPTAALDQSATEKVETLLRDWAQAEPRAIIWVSHDTAQRQRIATQEWHIANGALQCQ